MTEQPARLGISTQLLGATAILRVTGDFDVHAATRVRDEALDVMDGAATVLVMDLGGVTFLDSVGVGVLVQALKRARARDVRFCVVPSREAVTKLLRMTGLYKVFLVFDSVDQAVAALHVDGTPA